MESCDVLIVGGGPGGSSLAWGLRNSGMDVLLIDKQVFPRNKVCAGWITPAIIETLKIDLEDYARNNVLQPICGFSVGMIGQKQIDVSYGSMPVSYGIRRFEFDHYLLKRCGARVSSVGLNTIERVDDHWIINGNIRTSLLIGAGGHFCPVARYLGARPGLGETSVAAQELEFRMSDAQLASCQVQAEIPELYFCEDLKGYGWIFRKGNYLNIGIGREDQHALSSHVRQFCQYLKKHGRIPDDTPEKFQGHAYLLYQHGTRRIVSDGVMLVGDAAGFAYTRSGEGIRPAIESALLAARVIIAANGEYSSEKLSSYSDRVAGRFGRRTSRAIQDILPRSLVHRAARMLLGTRSFIRNRVIDRWFLHKDQLSLTSE